MRSLELEQVEAIIDECVDEFLDGIRRFRRKTKTSRKELSGFPVLDVANDEFYEYKSLERRLESMIRNQLVNRSLERMFHDSDPRIDCEWIDTSKILASNEGVERSKHFEFILKNDEGLVGYRYTPVDSNIVDDLLKQYNLDQIVWIDWSESRVNRIGAHRSHQVVKGISVRDFFENFFSEEIYRMYISRMKSAVSEANDIFGFQTISHLSVRRISSFKEKIKNELTNINNYKSHYKLLNHDNQKTRCYAYLESETFSESDFELMVNRFVNEGRYKALLGKQGFARCFLTSEYLLTILNKEYHFDYTAIATGYFKAIEQLLYTIVKSEMPNENLYIKRNRRNRKKNLPEGEKRIYRGNKSVNQVPFTAKNEPWFDISMGPLIYFMDDNPNTWILTDADNQLLIDYLNCFKDECRNEHFHKDNIDEYDVVVKIRSNTYLLMLILLGGCRLSGNIGSDKELLGIEDDSFERIYNKLLELPLSENRYVMQFDTMQEVKAIRLYSQDNPVYDEYGSVKESNVKFAIVNSYDYDDYEVFEEGLSPEQMYILTRDNMPQRIWRIKRSSGERVEI